MHNLIGLFPEIKQACFETSIMFVLGLSATVLLGGPLGILLFLWQKNQLLESPYLYKIVGTFTNVIRSFPFVILMVALTPFTQILAGTTIGPVAVSVPLTFSAVPYFARLVEQSLNEIPRGTIEAAVAMGASVWRLVFGVLLVEARSSLILSTTTLMITYLSFTAAAGVVGGGGIGDLAIRHGYYRFQTDVMIAMVSLLIIVVQLIQFSGQWASSWVDHRSGK
jgi:D-methionine transport system permease protein